MSNKRLKIGHGGGVFRSFLAGTAIFIGAFVLTALASSILMPVQPSDAYNVTTVLNSSGYTINLTAADQVNMSIAATADGVYASAKDTINVKTTAPGYTLYLSMNNDDTDGNRLYRGGDNTSPDYFSPVAGTFTAPTTLGNNTWGFAMVGDGSSFSTSYEIPTPAITSTWAAVPIRSGAVPIYTSSVANANPGDNIDIYYGVKANTALPSGVYSNTISYSAVANGASLDVAAISPERTNKLAGGEQVTITTSLTAVAANVGPVSVYIGGEACTDPVVSNGTSGNIIIKCNTPAAGTGTYNVTVNIPDYSKTYYIAGGIEYYQDAPAPGITNLTYMHEMTSAACDATTTPLVTDTTVPQVTLIDVRGRDGTGTIENPATGNNEQTYMVRKLADGNCWMVQNLNLNLSTGVTLNSTTSDLTSGRTWTPQNNTQTAEGTAWAQNGGDVARSFEPGEAMYFANGVGTGTLDTTTYNYPGYLSSGSPYWHVGNYYNWYAATAGTGLAATATDGTETAVSDSICPKGWRLPDNSGTKSFVNLVATTYGITDDTAGATKLLAAPLNFVRSGLYLWSEARVRYRGYYGYWWSNTAYAALSAHYLHTNPTRVIPQNGLNKGHGFSVRCVAR